ncbi:Radical SAM domain protein [Dehalogenimonas lykanthroporepellens BL-DC-9]|jgi:radical SAM superfamily enzyme YgiQ (UPF0313 family)|nr:Radical SAM domain protein [Dehalogenimonas lykanthroporepellens BL-DC-9]
MVWNKQLNDRLEAESGTIRRDWGGRFPVAVVYPNSYRIGMSNLGVHALYAWLNGRNDFLAERVFWDEAELSSSGSLSIESRRPLTDFSLLAFSVSWELDYLNLPRMLKAAGLPPRASERDESQPLVIGGGAPLTANPAPVASFFDAIAIGEAEAILPALTRVLPGLTGLNRTAQLEILADLPGLYVPGISTRPVPRVHPAELDEFPVSTAVFTTDTEFGDSLLLEVQRGCRFACRFCLVARAFCPFRWRSTASLLKQAAAGRRYRERVALVGPVVSEHPDIVALLRGLRQMGYGLSMSSMRVKPLSPEVLAELVAGGVKSLSIAPEAGNAPLRKSLGKSFSDDEVVEAVELVGASGIRQLTLYAMAGLPGESDDDIASLAKLVLRCKAKAEKYRLVLSLNVSAFIPKPQTPFERQPMADASQIEKRLEMLTRTLSPHGIKVKPDNVDWGLVQAALSRGDERLAPVIEQIDRGSLAGWRRAMKQQDLSTADYAQRRFDNNEPLPWNMVEM